MQFNSNNICTSWVPFPPTCFSKVHTARFMKYLSIMAFSKPTLIWLLLTRLESRWKAFGRWPALYWSEGRQSTKKNRTYWKVSTNIRYARTSNVFPKLPFTKINLSWITNEKKSSFTCSMSSPATCNISQVSIISSALTGKQSACERGRSPTLLHTSPWPMYTEPNIAVVKSWKERRTFF